MADLNERWEAEVDEEEAEDEEEEDEEEDCESSPTWLLSYSTIIDFLKCFRLLQPAEATGVPPPLPPPPPLAVGHEVLPSYVGVA